MATITKKEIWANAQDILNNLGLSKAVLAAATEKFEVLLAPKKAGMTRPQPLEIDGTLYYYCRFTGLYFISENMIYQNPEKKEALDDKGYSKYGISLWTKGQKYLKDIQIKSTNIAYGVGYDNADPKVFAEGKELMELHTKLKKDNSANDYSWLMKNIADAKTLVVIEANGKS